MKKITKKINSQLSTLNFQLIIMLLFLLGCKAPVITESQSVENMDSTYNSKEKLEKNLQRFEEADNDIDKIKALTGAALGAMSFPEEEEAIYQKLADFVEEASDSEIKIYAYNILMGLYMERDISLSFTYFQKAMKLIPKFPEYSEIMKADIYLMMAIIFSMYNDFENTQQYLFEAIPIFEAQQEKDYQKIKDKTNISIYGELSMAYSTAMFVSQFFENKEKEDEYLNKLLLLVEKCDKPLDKASGYLNISSYVQDEDTKLKYIEMAYKIATEIQSADIISRTYFCFSVCEEAKGNIPAAIAWLEKNLEFVNGKEMTYDEMLIYNDLAHLYDLAHYSDEKVLNLDLKGLALADSLHVQNYLAIFHDELGKQYCKCGNYKEAYHHQKEFITLMEELHNEESLRQINFISASFNAKSREAKISELEEREKIRKTQLITGLSVCVIIFSLLWYLLRMRKRRNRFLAEMNTTKDKFFSIISHDLKNPAVAQQDAIRKLLEKAELLNNDELTQSCRNLLKSADEEVKLLYSLLTWAQIQTQGITYTPITFDLPKQLQNDIALIRKMAESKNIILKVHSPDHVLVTGDINILLTVIRNLLTNAVKFTPVGGEVSLAIETTYNGKHTITVSDTGIGMTPEEKNNLFRIDHSLSRKGTLGEQGTGLGLIVCNNMLKKHGSTLFVESEEGKGSKFWFEI